MPDLLDLLDQIVESYEADELVRQIVDMHEGCIDGNSTLGVDVQQLWNEMADMDTQLEELRREVRGLREGLREVMLDD